MKSADEAETGLPPRTVEGRIPPSTLEDTGGGKAAVPTPEGDAARVVSLPPSSDAVISVPSIANLTAALITNTIPLSVLQNGVALNASLVVPQSTLQNVNPSLAEFKGQGAKILPNDFGLHLVTDPNFRPPVVIGLPATSMAASVKRETDDESLSETDDDSNSNQEWSSAGGRMHLDDGAIDYSVTASNCSGTAVGAETATKKMRTLTGSRRSYRDAKLTPEEEERRKMRRERNKLAAAKCRQKRVDQTNQLLAETQVLEEEQSRLEEEIKKYQQQKEELEFVLEAHRLQCGLGKQTTLAPQVSSNSASAPLRLPSESVPPVKSEHSEGAGKDLKAPAVQGARVVPIMQRPNSFPMVSRPLPVGISQVLGIPISTPSSGIVITLGLDSMLDGHTGLTPITGVPSIVAQTPQNPTSDIAPPSSDTLTPATTALMSL